MQTVVNYLSEVKLELSKVVWPKRDEVIRLTLVVIAISFIVGVYTGGIDFIFTKLLGVVVSR